MKTDVTLPDVAELHRLADIILAAEAATNHAESLSHAKWAYPAHIRRRILPGFEITAPNYLTALNDRHRHLDIFIKTTLMDNGILILPTIGCPVPTIASTDQASVGFMPEMVASLTWWTRWLNYLGVPALSAPCGTDRNGMPIGMQLVAAPFDERRLFETAIYYESHIDWRKTNDRAIKASENCGPHDSNK